MGKYIHTPGNTDKAAFILSDAPGSTIIETPPARFRDVPEGKTLVVVINNGMYETAGVAYDVGEFQAVTLPTDLRLKTFLLVPTEYILKMFPDLAPHYPTVK